MVQWDLLMSESEGWDWNSMGFYIIAAQDHLLFSSTMSHVQIFFYCWYLAIRMQICTYMMIYYSIYTFFQPGIKKNRIIIIINNNNIYIYYTHIYSQFLFIYIYGSSCVSSMAEISSHLLGFLKAALSRHMTGHLRPSCVLQHRTRRQHSLLSLPNTKFTSIARQLKLHWRRLRRPLCQFSARCWSTAGTRYSFQPKWWLLLRSTHYFEFRTGLRSLGTPSQHVMVWAQGRVSTVFLPAAITSLFPVTCEPPNATPSNMLSPPF